MTKLRKQLIVLVTTCSLLFASMNALLHEHHGASGSCCSHGHALRVADCEDHGDSGHSHCCGSGHDCVADASLDHVQQSEFFAISQDLSGNTQHDGPCALCRFLTEHFTQLEVFCHIPLDSSVISLVSVETEDVQSSISLGYFLRGPPQI